MRVGLDLDGTIVVYDELFHRHAAEAFGMPPDVPVRKEAVRDWIRGAAPGERGWRELQRLVYGPLIGEAPRAPGIEALFAACDDAGAEIVVVSHKSRWSAAEPRTDLHAAARGWLERERLLGGPVSEVFFEPTRADKLRRIAELGCVLFADDLVEVLGDPAFPAAAERWLYAPRGASAVPDGVTAFNDWALPAARIGVLAGRDG